MLTRAVFFSSLTSFPVCYRNKMSLCLTGKTALVTGAYGELGRAVVKGLVEAGCFVIGTDRLPRYSVDSLFEELQIV